MKKLNFGCGLYWKPGWDNADIQKNENINLNFDFNSFPYPIESNTYDFINADNILEHLFDLRKVLAELYRISKNDANIEIIVPYYNNKGAFNDIEHIHYFSKKTLQKLVTEPQVVNKRNQFKLVSIKLRPTKVGKFIPGPIREKLANFIGGIIEDIVCVLKVKKE